MKESLYSIKDLETLSGIKAHTIRIWEKRYNLLEPQRTNTNIRFYCDEDLKRILNVAMLVKRGFRISKVSGWDGDKVKTEILNLNEVSNTQSDFIERLIISTVNFDEDSINSALNDIIKTFGFEDSFRKVIFPFFEKVGLYWQVGSIFPIQEHFISNLIRQKIISEIDRLSAITKHKNTILFFLHENERHELGLLFYNMVALSAGYKILYLGQNIPLDDLKNFQFKKKADFIFTTFINSITKKDLQDYLLQLSEIFEGKKVFISGRQVAIHQPTLPRNFKIIASAHEFKRYLGV